MSIFQTQFLSFRGPSVSRFMTKRPMRICMRLDNVEEHVVLAIIICLGARSIVIMHRKCIKRRALPAWVQPSRACIEQYSIAAGKTYLYLKSCLKYSCLVQYNDKLSFLG